jgi:hypothetical protein
MANKKDVAVFRDIFTNNRLGWNTGLPFPRIDILWVWIVPN